MSRSEPQLTVRGGGWLVVFTKRSHLAFLVPLLVVLPGVVTGAAAGFSPAATVLSVLFVCVPIAYVFLVAMGNTMEARFHADRIEIGGRFWSYEELGHLETPAINELQLRFRSPRDGAHLFRTISVRPGTAEDLLDRIVELIRNHAPEHVFSIREQGQLTFNQDFDLAAHFADRSEPTHEVVAKPPDARVVAIDGCVSTEWGMELARIEGHWPDMHLRVCDGTVLRMDAARRLHDEAGPLGVYESRAVQDGWHRAVRLDRPLPQYLAEMLYVACAAHERGNVASVTPEHRSR